MNQRILWSNPRTLLFPIALSQLPQQKVRAAELIIMGQWQHQQGGGPILSYTIKGCVHVCVCVTLPHLPPISLTLIRIFKCLQPGATNPRQWELFKYLKAPSKCSGPDLNDPPHWFKSLNHSKHRNRVSTRRRQGGPVAILVYLKLWGTKMWKNLMFRYDKRIKPPVTGSLRVNISVVLLSLSSPDESSLVQIITSVLGPTAGQRL